MIKIVDNETMRLSDQETIKSKTPSKELMLLAAKGVFNSVDWKGKILIVCGKGNNAGDGYALSGILKEKNYCVTLLLIEEKFSEDGKFYFLKAKEKGVEHCLFSEDMDFSGYDIIVDCIFGTGFSSIPKGAFASAIEKINSSGAYVVSVDINSGLNGDNGMGSVVVNSSLTVSIGNFKFGHFLNKAKDFIKQIINIDIGIDIVGKFAWLLEEKDIKQLFEKRKNFSNKGDYGYVGILGGCSRYPGAIQLANLGQACLYSGCGVSKIIVPECISSLIYPNILESTVVPISSTQGFMNFNPEEITQALKGLKALAIGVGWGTSEGNQKILKFILENYDFPLIIDADGINNLTTLRADILNQTKCKVILTPHLKEFSRLSGLTIEEILQNPVKASMSFSDTHHVTLLLKGPTTIVASNGEVYLSNTGCPGMATAGSGDVLTGIITGLLGYSKESLGLTVAGASYINGLAGQLASEEFSDVSMTSRDTAMNIKRAISKIIRD